MTRDNWIPVNISEEYADAIDEFLKKPEARRNDIASRAKLIRFLLDNFFREYKDATGEDLMSQEIKTIDDLLASAKKNGK